MRTYQLYLIEDEFAAHYFGRERMFFQLFHEFEGSSGEFRSILAKQIQFITKPIHAFKLHQELSRQLYRSKGFLVEDGEYHLKLAKNSRAKLQILDTVLVLEASGSYEAETVFFEILRKVEASFLAIDLRSQRYGWLKPIKERKLV